MSHPVIKASLEVSSIGAIISYWIGALPAVVAFGATTASLIYYSLSIYYLTKKDK